ncbi:hypothetical protein ABZW18_03800 [Streptomyces sp. NPDC004647]|uniref:hypothetical protein n=1 Tax=Streptomyces sp. NPDC004647 TaxID=3154671 RepID=UPI0033A9ABA0
MARTTPARSDGPARPTARPSRSRPALRDPAGRPGRTGLCGINCHATTGPTAADSRLELDSTPNPACELTVAEILADTYGRDPRAAGGLVVLANCTSDPTLTDHDEALTLSTVFLGAGAASVVGLPLGDRRRPPYLLADVHVPPLPQRPGTVRSPGGGRLTGRRPARRCGCSTRKRVAPRELGETAREIQGRPLDDLQIWAALTHHGH